MKEYNMTTQETKPVVVLGRLQRVAELRKQRGWTPPTREEKAELVEELRKFTNF
jgi:hypothetical protein